MESKKWRISILRTYLQFFGSILIHFSITSFSQTTRLFEWGYNNYEALTYGEDVEEPDLPDPEATEDPQLEEALLEDSLWDEAQTVSPSLPVQEIQVPAPSTELAEAVSPTPCLLYTSPSPRD